jgi:hypothetical protein
LSLFLPEANPKSVRRRNWAWAIVGALVVSVCLAKPAAGLFKKLDARKHAAEGEAYLAQRRYSDAAQCASAALRMDPSNTRALRVALEALGQESRPEAVQYWLRLAQNSAAVLDDHRHLLQWAIRWRQRKLAASRWSIIEKERPFSKDDLMLGAGYYDLAGDPQNAVQFARAALEQSPSNIQMRLLLGRVLLASGGERDRQIGKHLLLEQVRGTSEAGIESLRILAANSVLAPFEADDCRRLLKEHPLHAISDVLADAGLAAQVTPYKRDTILLAGARQFIEATGHIREAAEWLTAASAQEIIPDIISVEKALGSRDLFLNLADGLGARKDWKALDDLLSRTPLPISAVEAAMYQARTAQELKQPRIAALRWDEALHAARSDGAQLIQLAAYARRFGADAIAEQAARKAIEGGGPAARFGYEELLQGCKHDLPRACVILREMAQAFPSDPAVLNDLTYARLLLKEPDANAVSVAESLVSKAPGLLAYRATLALAYLRAGSPEKARRAMEPEGQSNSSWREFHPYELAIYAAACGAAGDSLQAVEAARAIDRTALKKEETELAHKWLSM